MQIIVLDKYNGSKNYKEDIVKTISAYYDIPVSDLIIEKDVHGKPYLVNFKDIYISISHSKVHLLYAISDKNIGVDIEVIRPVKNYFDKIKRKAFHENELSYILKNSQELEIRFFEIWTKKEAYLKCLGIGLTTELTKIDTLNLKHIVTIRNRDLVYSICSEY